MSRLQTFILTSLAIITMAAAQEVSPKEASVLREARALRKKDPAAAKAFLQKRLEKTPSEVHLYELGLWHAADGEHDQAAATYRTLIKKNPTYPGAMRNLGILLLRGSKFAEATKVLAKLGRREPLGAELQRSLGTAFSALGNHTAALAAYRNAVVGYPDDDGLQLRIAFTLFELKAYDEAEAAARGVQTRSPATSEAWLVIGNCHAAQKRYEKAADALEAARRLTKTSSDELMVALGDLYVLLGLPKTAMQRYSAASKVANDKLLGLGRQFIETGELDEALKVAKTLESRADGEAATNVLTGLCDVRRKRYPQAEAALKTALKADPVNGEILATLGDIAAKQKKTTEAVSWYRAARAASEWKRYAMEAELDLYLTIDDKERARGVLAGLKADFPSPQWDRLLQELSAE